jgi:hypothetical protein
MAQTAKVRSAAVVEAALQIGDDAANTPVILAYSAFAYSVFPAGAAVLFRRGSGGCGNTAHRGPLKMRAFSIVALMIVVGAPLAHRHQIAITSY